MAARCVPEASPICAGNQVPPAQRLRLGPSALLVRGQYLLSDGPTAPSILPIGVKQPSYWLPSILPATHRPWVKSPGCPAPSPHHRFTNCSSSDCLGRVPPASFHCSRPLSSPLPSASSSSAAASGISPSPQGKLLVPPAQGVPGGRGRGVSSGASHGTESWCVFWPLGVNPNSIPASLSYGVLHRPQQPTQFTFIGSEPRPSPGFRAPRGPPPASEPHPAVSLPLAKVGNPWHQ